MTNEKIKEVAEKVARVLAENQATFSDVNRIFREVEFHLTVSLRNGD